MVDEDSTALSRRPDALDGPVVSQFILEVTEGGDISRSFTIDGTQPTRLYLGKSTACEIRLSDPRVSRRHAAFEPDGVYLRLTDLESLNGTFVNGVRACDVRLEGGETVRVGSSAIKVTKAGTKVSPPATLANRFGRVFGASPEMRRLFPLCERLAKSDVPVIIEGETGTGKELLAESIHEASARAKGPFVVFDCTAVPPNLVESALFGHEKGAFTGAVSARRGVFEQADGGTLLIDEIGDLEIGLQAKLLRALERAEIQRVGGTGWTRVDVRILCATRRDLEREIQAGRFRDDLFYRLAVARLERPPLRRRAGDVAMLVHHFWQALRGPRAELTSDVVARFESYAWPGNVRELHNAIAHRIALGDLADIESIRRSGPSVAAQAAGEVASSATVGDVVGRVIRDGVPFITARSLVLADFERRYCEWVLERNGGNATKAAASSGIARRYFYVLKNRSRG
jgi:DNA-binding NtrC family response regulator